MIRDLMFNFVIFGIMQTGAELFRENLVMRIDQNWSGFMEKCSKILYHKVDIFSISTFFQILGDRNLANNVQI